MKCLRCTNQTTETQRDSVICIDIYCTTCKQLTYNWTLKVYKNVEGELLLERELHSIKEHDAITVADQLSKYWKLTRS